MVGGWTDTHTTNSMKYIYGLDRIVGPMEAFRQLGFPALNAANVSETEQFSLLGECMCPPCITVVLFATLIVGHAQVWHA